MENKRQKSNQFKICYWNLSFYIRINKFSLKKSVRDNKSIKDIMHTICIFYFQIFSKIYFKLSSKCINFF